MNNFDDIYAKLIANNEQLEKSFEKTKNSDRKLSNYANIITLILFVLIIIISVFIKFYPLIFISIIFLILFRIIFKLILELIFGVAKEKNDLNNDYKSKIVSILIDNIYENAEYFPTKEMSRNIYDESHFEEYDGVYNINYDDMNFNKREEYYSEDYIECAVNNNLVQIAGITRKEIYKDSDGEEQEDLIFSGIFAKIDLDKNSNINMKIISSIGEQIENKVMLDYATFEKYFNVSSDDSNKTLQILTADVLNYLVELRNKIKMDFDININNDKLYIRIHSDDVFELNSYKKDIFDKKILYNDYLVLSAIKDLIVNLSNVIYN